MYRFILKTAALCLVLLSSLCSFGMIVRYKSKDDKKAVNAYFQRVTLQMKHNDFDKLDLSSTIHIINRLDNPIIFGQTNKENHAMVKEEGKRNLEELYRKRQDFCFVSDFLLSHYVPILIFHSHFDWDCDSCKKYFRLVNFYEKSYYDLETNKLYHNFDEKIIALKKKRLDQAIEISPYNYKVKYGYSCYLPIDAVVLFGRDKDISKELENKDYYINLGYALTHPIEAVMHYPNKKNNALKLLLLKLKEFAVPCSSDISDYKRRGYSSYELLYNADRAKNREAFALLAEMDPYNANTIAWTNHYSIQPQSNLSWMIADGKFDPENIKLFKQYSSKTDEDLKI